MTGPLNHKFSVGPVILRVSVAPEAFPHVLGFARELEGGAIEVLEDVPSSPEDFAEELRTVTAVLQPSRAEGFGLIPLQAVACGTPALLTGATGHAEYVEDIERGSLCVRTGPMQMAIPGRLC